MAASFSLLLSAFSDPDTCGRNDLLERFHLNVRSARNKTAELDSPFSEFDFSFDILIIAKIWYTDEIEAFTLPQYRKFCASYTASPGGKLRM